MKKYCLVMATMLSFIANSSNAALVVIGTFSWPGATPTNLIYDDNGRRGANGSISGGLIWLDHTHNESEVRLDATLGMGENARLYAQALTQQSGAALITLKPGFTIESWDGDWRLPHSGTYPTSDPVDSEMLHLVTSELGNTLGDEFNQSGVFEDLWMHPAGGGFYGYWLGFDTEPGPGLEIWYHTGIGQQEIAIGTFRGGRAIFVRSATVSFDPLQPGAPETPSLSNLPEGYTFSEGSSSDANLYGDLHSYVPASGTSSAEIVGIGIAGSNDFVYVWHQNGLVTSGNPSDLGLYRPPYPYSLPSGKTPSDIVGMGIAGSNDRVYAWYRDGTVSSGSSSDLDLYRQPYQFSLPLGKSTADIIGMGIAGSNDRVYAWYRDGSVSSGNTSDLELFRGPYLFTLPLGKTPADVVGMGISGSNDHVFTWYRPYIR